MTNDETLLLKRMYEIMDENDKLCKIGEVLGLRISHGFTPQVSLKDLLEIFSDENRVKEICSKLKNKAFW